MADEKDKSKEAGHIDFGDRPVYPNLRDRESVAAHNPVPPLSHVHRRHAPPLYGVMAEFNNPKDLVAAAHRTYEAGYRRINGYSPYPIEELWEAIGFKHTRLPLIVFIGGLIGAFGGFFMQYWMEVVDYPLIVGGKPFNSWPAFIPITFECTILGAAFAAVFGMLALNKLPQPYHPVFNAPSFALATRDSFFLVIEAKDVKFNHDEAVRFLKNLDPREVVDVEL